MENCSYKFVCRKPNGEVMQYLYNQQEFEIVESNEKYGIIDSNGNVIIPIMYDLINFYEYDDLILAYLNGKWGYIDWEDNVVIPFQYRYAELFWESDNAIVAIDKKKWGIINKQGETVLPFEYDNIIITFENGMARVCKNDRVYEIDINGNEI